MTPEHKRLIEWVAKESESESAFLTSFPTWTVDFHRLLDKIADLFEISEDEISKIIDDKRKE